jgi:adenine deaminase
MGYKIERLMDVALKKRKAERVLKNCRVVNVFSGEIEEGDVALQDGYIAGVGRFDGIEEEDLGGKIVCPGFIDSHVHIESAMVTPPVFASVVVARGTTSVIADPHEIANVLGAAGIEYMIRSSRDLFLYLVIIHLLGKGLQVPYPFL